MVTGFILIGQDKLLSNHEVKKTEMNDKTAEALRKAGGEIIRVSVQKTPIQTGELRSRSFNEGPLKYKDIYTQVIGYEKFADTWNAEKSKAYAVYVHENLEAQHHVGEAKFLEHAIQETSGKIINYLKREMQIK